MVYETSFLFLPNFAADELATQVGKLKEVITSNGGEIISEEYPQMIDLAYDIRHRLDNKYTNFETAQFGWVKYNAEQAAAPEIKKALDLMKSLLRYITVKTVAENTMVEKDVFAILQGGESTSAPAREMKKAPVAEEVEVNEEKVDEELDKMLDEEPKEEVPAENAEVKD